MKHKLCLPPPYSLALGAFQFLPKIKVTRKWVQDIKTARKCKPKTLRRELSKAAVGCGRDGEMDVLGRREDCVSD